MPETNTSFIPKEGEVQVVPYDSTQNPNPTMVTKTSPQKMTVDSSSPNSIVATSPVAIRAKATQFHPNDRVRLKIRIITGGNPYHCGLYWCRQIPKQYWTSQYLELVSPNKPQPQANYQNVIQTQTIKLTTEKSPNQQLAHYGNPEPTIVDRGAKTKTDILSNIPAQTTLTNAPSSTTIAQTNEISQPKVSINLATAQELSGLPNIGAGTATKILAARKEQPFIDLKDLSERITLPRGNWAEIENRIIFEASNIPIQSEQVKGDN